MFNSKSLKNTFAALLLGASIPIYATPITWISQSSNDLNLSSNWNPANVPAASDDAIFDSTIPGIITNPVGQGIDFTCSNFQFPFEGFPFNITIQNRQLIFDGLGIIGNDTSATVTVTNTDTPYTVSNQLFFNGTSSTSNAATLTVSNDATISGAPPTTYLSVIDRQIYSPNAFIMSSRGEMSANNFGRDFSSGAGGDIAAGVFQGQVIFGDTCTLGNDVRMSVINNGLSSSPVTNNLVGYVIEWQLHAADDFVTGDSFNLFVANAGLDFSVGMGGQTTANIASVSGMTGMQIEMDKDWRVGDFANILVLNNGYSAGSYTTDPRRIGTMLNDQIRIHEAFESNDSLNMNVLNEGRDSSSGIGGNYAGVLGGAQLRCDSNVQTGNDSFIYLQNFGSNIGINSTALNVVGEVFKEQITVAGTFLAEDSLTLLVANKGIDSAQSSGSNHVGVVGSIQAKLSDTFNAGNKAVFWVTNQGTNTGSTTGLGNQVGTVQNTQLDIEGEFQVGNSLDFNVVNTGVDSSTGIGANKTAAVLDVSAEASQVLFNNKVTIGNQALMTVSNSGICSGTTSSQGNKVGYLNQDQFHVSGTFVAGNDFVLEVSNTGNNSSISAGVDEVGVVTSGLQLCFGQESTFGDNVKLTVSNKGTYTGNAPSNTYTGYVFDNQACFEGLLTAGNNFNLEVSNEGTADTIGNGNSVGTSITQLDLDVGCMLGDNATILVTNKGTNSNPTGVNNLVGYVIGDQAFINGFTAGKNLEFSVNNSAENTGNGNNSVGYVTGSQIVFSDAANFNDNSLVLVSNNGTVTDSQMVFQNGFNILSGKATFQTINSGNLGNKGIYVQDGLGGNVNIVLSNSSLYVDTTLPTFTIGELNGDITSTVESLPQLIINTEALTNANFDGVIQNFSANSSTLKKTGSGTQKLSGVNTYTGLTSIDAGTLVLNGSVAGDVTVNLLGKLKGIGTIDGNLINYGIVSPGESIGTLNVLGNYTNSSGTYEVEVNGAGQSDLIDVSGNVFLNGGTVVVSTPDGAFNFIDPYTIVSANGIVVGTYTRATSKAFITPILTYDLQHVYLTIEPDLIRASATCNQLGVAVSLDNLPYPNAEQSLLISTIANLSRGQAQRALESFSGFQYTQNMWTTEIANRRFIRRLYDPLRSLVSSCDCCCGYNCELTPWLEIGGGSTHLCGKAHKMNSHSYDLTGGIQNTFSDLTLGFAGSYEHEHISYRNGHEDRNSEYVAVYGLYRPCAFYSLVDFVYGHGSSHFKRSMHAGLLSFRAHSKPKIQTFAFYAETGFDLNRGCALIQPFIGIQAGKNWRERIKESRAEGWGLTISKKDWSPVSSRLGFHVSQRNFYGCVDATLDVTWNHLWTGHKNSSRGRFRDFWNNSYKICGKNVDRDSFDYAFTLQTCLYKNFRAYIEVEGEAWASSANTINLIGGITFSW